MTSKEAFDDIVETLKWCCNDGKNLTEYDKERMDIIEEELKEKDKLFNQLYLVTEENKLLLKQNKKLEKKNQMLLERVIDYARRLGIEINYEKII